MTPREISGKACYLGYMHKMGFEPRWEKLPEATKEAWIAGAYESKYVDWIIAEHKKEPA